ncbi:MAG: hypothetical protein M0Q49_11400 [Porticoccaceae bacterium]|nr:hypothetical protein [Porticoccaceae bacterium]
MAAGPWVVTNSARTKLLNGQFNIGADSFKVALFQSTSNLGVGSTTYAGVTDQVAEDNGYETGGVDITLGLDGTTVVNVTGTPNPEWVADGGSIVARFAALYEVGGDVLAFMLLDAAPADVTVTDTNTLTIDVSDGIFDLE